MNINITYKDKTINKIKTNGLLKLFVIMYDTFIKRESLFKMLQVN